MKRDKEFDEILRSRISEILEEPIEESVDADDLMFDLGFRYLRMIEAKKKKMTKVSMIAQQVGRCPVLSFGNSAGDISMTNFVKANKHYKTEAFFVCCDDDVREHGSIQKAQNVYDFCAQNGWIPISMKNDWLTVFGEGITKKA